MKSKHLFLFIILIWVIIAQAGCAAKGPVTKTEFYLDTACSITIYNFDENQAENLIDEAFALCEKYEDMLSKTVPGSDIDLINESKGKTVAVHPDTMTLLKKSYEYGQLSNGKFDITVGAVTELWNFKEENPSPPSEEEILKAIETVGYGFMHLEDNEVWIENIGTKLDLGGIAKGYIADQVSLFLIEQGVEKAILNFGGNIVAIGEKEKGVSWSIGVEKPFSNRQEMAGLLYVQNQTVVTAGVYERYFEWDGEVYHHIIDPDTGYPTKSDLQSVTIISEIGNSADCDALSTYCMILGAGKSKKLIENMTGFEGVFIDNLGNITYTPGVDFQLME